MSEEEMLDIIDRIIRYKSLMYFGYNTSQIGYEALEKIVKQYKEQQKEIKELEDITRAYDGMQEIMPEGHPIIIADKEYFDSGRFTEKYISKDKIREKIKELEKQEDKWWKFDAFEEYLAQLNILKELLGDE